MVGRSSGWGGGRVLSTPTRPCASSTVPHWAREDTVQLDSLRARESAFHTGDREYPGASVASLACLGASGGRAMPGGNALKVGAMPPPPLALALALALALLLPAAGAPAIKGAPRGLL